MKIFFPTRNAARDFTANSARKVGDANKGGNKAPANRRWFVSVK